MWLRFGFTPLRERQDDILPLAEFLLKKHGPSRDGAVADHARAAPSHDGASLAREYPRTRERHAQILVIRDADLIAEDLRTRSHRHGTLHCSQLHQSVATAGASAATADEEPPSTPILKQVNKAKEQAETDAILVALQSTRWEPQTGGPDPEHRLQSTVV